jgi:hypothetical protein
VLGVNGSGKTTTIGKLAARHRAEGKRVVLGAGDTFRAAAIEQLEIWGQRVDSEVVKGQAGGDPASVAFDTIKAATARGADVAIVDTAGRLQTKAPLVEELRKIVRVIGRDCPGAPHEVLLVIDANTGQNAISQARVFTEAAGVTGLVLTKLDGTAKGGVLVGSPTSSASRCATSASARRPRTCANSRPRSSSRRSSRRERHEPVRPGARPRARPRRARSSSTATGRSPRSTSTSSRSTSRSPAGSSTTPARSGSRSCAPRAARSGKAGATAADIAGDRHHQPARDDGRLGSRDG